MKGDTFCGETRAMLISESIFCKSHLKVSYTDKKMRRIVWIQFKTQFAVSKRFTEQIRKERLLRLS